MKNPIPETPLKFLRWFCKTDLLDEIEGDLVEAYYQRSEYNRKRARRLLWFDVLRSFKLKNIGLMKNQKDSSIKRTIAILSQYFKVFIRTIARSRMYTSITILSLTLGISCALMIFMYIYKELQYDRFYSDSDRIYRIAFESKNTQRSYAFAPLALTPHMIENFDGVEDGVRIFKYRREIPVTIESTRVSYNEGGFAWCDPSFFDIFDIEIIKGNATDPLIAPGTIAISESTAKRYFGDKDPIGQLLQFNWTENSTLRVTSVYKDFPSHSHFSFDLLSSLETCQDIMWPRPQINSWQNLFTAGYLKLKDGISPDFINDKIQEAINENFQPGGPTRIISFLQPIEKIHLNSDLDLGEWGSNGSMKKLLIFGIIGIVIVGLGSFNFINMVTAMASQRSKEIGVRKVFGGTRKNVLHQTYFETFLYVICAFLLSVLIIIFSIPVLEKLTGHVYHAMDFYSIDFLLPIFAFLVTLIIISGLYPALYISGFQAIKLISNKSIASESSKLFRNALVLSQFTISIVLLICTLIIYLQLSFMRNKDIGFDQSLIVTVPIHNDDAVIPKLEAWKAEATKYPGIHSISASSHEIFAEYTYISLFSLAGSEEEYRWERYTVDEDYLNTFDLKVIAGRAFSKNIQSDSSAFVLNESAVKALGYTPDAIIGQTINNLSDEVSGKVVGVVKDFHFRSLHQSIDPFVIYVNKDRLDFIAIRLSGNNFRESIVKAEETWNEIIGEDIPFFYTFMDQKMASRYEKEANEGRLFSILSSISLLLGCMGLFGLALFITQRKVKEIGIRKVLGAGVMNILILINSKFMKIIGISFIIALPIAYFLMERWLMEFAYRISQPFWVYAVTGMMIFLISILTVSYLSANAAFSNPVKSIRNE